MRPIITHPERNPILQKDHLRMAEWMRSGCLVQITAGSLGSRWAGAPQSLGWELLEKNWVHFIATDAHNLEGRRRSVTGIQEGNAQSFRRRSGCVWRIRGLQRVRQRSSASAAEELEGVYVYDDPGKRTGLMSKLFGEWTAGAQRAKAGNFNGK